MLICIEEAGINSKMNFVEKREFRCALTLRFEFPAKTSLIITIISITDSAFPEDYNDP